MLPFHCPSRVQDKVSCPTREYPAMQLNLYSDPCIQPVPLTYPLVMEGGSSGHSNGKKNITYYRISSNASVWEKKRIMKEHVLH